MRRGLSSRQSASAIAKTKWAWWSRLFAPGARAARKLARERSRYPGGGYLHAVQSVAMLQAQLGALTNCLQRVDAAKDPDLDLVLHLVASHHGECRPFAPVLIDESPVEVSLDGHESERFGQIDFAATTSNNGLHSAILDPHR
ncbi:MAG: hypothetical protein MJD61_06550 [Proteobacteria bacterium]|nr:hypothetical protein [Pseudomonadota bacterium]